MVRGFLPLSLGDDEKAKRMVTTLANGVGYAPVDTGPLYTARYLENLNVQITVSQCGGTDAVLIYLQGSES